LNENCSGTLDQFDLRFLWYNAWAGFLAPAGWSGRFPYVQDSTPPSLPAGGAIEQVPFGIVSNLPLLWLVLGAVLSWRKRAGAGRWVLHWFVVVVAVLFGSSALILCLHNSMTLRYQSEFLVPLVLLAVVGMLGMEETLPSGQFCWRGAMRWVWGLLLTFSLAFNLAVMIDRSSDAHLQIGLAYFHNEQAQKAMVQFKRALELKPENAAAHNCVGGALIRQAKVQQGINHLREAIRLKPDFALAHGNLGVALLEQGKMRQAIGHLKEALRLNPKQFEALEALGKALVGRGQDLAGEGKWDEAIDRYQNAVRVNCDSVSLHESLGVALVKRGRRSEAVRHFRRAVELEPRLASALNSLALILATETNAAVGNVEEAVRCAERACVLTTNSVASYLDTLGMTYAEAGRFKEAVQAAEQAAALARASGSTNLAERIEGRLEHYRNGKPYRAFAKSGSR
jgi:tetratricopeptide (TPR) repeat protein